MTASSLLIIVPARGGSKRLPGKNLRKLAGKSLLAHTGEAIAASGLGTPVLLSTDDDAIAAEGAKLGWQVPFRRPAEMADDSATTDTAVLHSLDWFRDQNGSDPDAVMVLQPTSPLRGAGCLAEAVRLLESRSDVDSIVSMTPLHLPAAHLYHAGPDGIAAPLAWDDRRPVYMPNGALYLTRVPVFRKEKTLYAGRVLPLMLSTVRSIDIDTEEDWFLAETILTAGPLPEAEDFAPKAAQ